jgi:hypothetical protein
MQKRRCPIRVMLLHEDEDFILVHTIFKDTRTGRDFDLSLGADDAITRKANGRTIYRVLDLTATRFVPPAAIQHFRRARHKWTQGSSSLTMLVTTHPLLCALVKTLYRMFPRLRPHLRHAATLEEAYSLIERLTTDELI